MFYEVMTLKRGARDSGVLTYSADDSLLKLVAGQIVEVPFGRGKTVAVVVKKVTQPDFATKPIMRIIYSTPLPAHLVKTAQFVADYYKAPLSSAVGLILPKGVEKKRRKPKTEQTEQINGKTEQSDFGTVLAKDGKRADYGSVNNTLFTKIKLNPHQKIALQGLQKAVGATKLLHGVTGSGKTNIYLKMAENALKQQKSVILLVPEIALTGQLVRIIGEVFGESVSLIHSGQTEVERHLIFESLLETDKPRIVVGPRSALFAPLHDLGLIIVDEEHENTYSQEITPKYSAIRVASYMAQILKCDCILGSATPTVADYYLANKKQAVIPLNVRAKNTARKADIQIIDFKNRDEFSKNRYFSNSLLKAIKRNLEAEHQTLIFHNRRGSSPLTICENCGEELACPYCFLPLTLHADNYELVCHTCGYREDVPSACPKCGSQEILHKGFGTKLLETEMGRLFPKARIRRFDADNKKGEGLEEVYDAVRDGDIDILIGTQTLAKGLDLPKLATVGVAQADAGLALPDYSAEERSFQLLTQVIGRVGRGHLDVAEVFIQTFRPEHPVISYAIAEDYLGFYQYMLKRRGAGGFPPFTFVAKCEITMKTESVVLRKVQTAVRELSAVEGLVVSPPMPAFHERTASGYTWQIIVRAKSRKKLVQSLDRLDANFRIALDPPSLL